MTVFLATLILAIPGQAWSEEPESEERGQNPVALKIAKS